MPSPGGIALNLVLSTVGATRQSKHFWNTFGQMARSSAAASLGTRSSLAHRPIAGAQGHLLGGIPMAFGGALAGPALGDMFGAATSAVGRIGANLFQGVRDYAAPQIAKTSALERLTPIAEAQALATGKIDEAGLRGLYKQFQELDTRRLKGRHAVEAMAGGEDINDAVEVLKRIEAFLRSLPNPFGK